MALLNEILKNDPGVAATYQHGPKVVMPGSSMETNGAVLKWYQLASQDLPVPDQIDLLAREFLARTPLEAKGLGFVILHRCGEDFYFLIVSTWRGNNEVWETVFYKEGDAMADFALWPREGMHKPAFCVWELAAVLYENKAWERFLKSTRDEAAAQDWQRDVYSGPA